MSTHSYYARVRLRAHRQLYIRMNILNLGRCVLKICHETGWFIHTTAVWHLPLRWLHVSLVLCGWVHSTAAQMCTTFRHKQVCFRVRYIMGAVSSCVIDFLAQLSYAGTTLVKMHDTQVYILMKYVYILVFQHMCNDVSSMQGLDDFKALHGSH